MIHVVPLRPFDQPLTYACPEEVMRGQVVMIPFRSQTIPGIVWKTDNVIYEGNVKSIHHVYPYIIPEETLHFIEWVSKYNMIPLGMALKFCVSKSVVEKEAKPLSFHYQMSLFDLSLQQKKVFSCILDPKPYVIDGITGSGKTEVYFHALDSILKQGKQGLVLLPEIALTKQWIDRFKRAFGTEPLTWHSKMTPAQKRKTWQAVLKKDPIIVVGARSALFLPFADLAMIVLDEEHDVSFKQNEPPFYHARDMAIVRAHFLKIPILLGSATPSLETYSAIQTKGYEHLVLPTRFGESVLPDLHVVDMSDIQGWISEDVKQAIRDGLYEKTQTLIYLNRRAYAPLSLCTKCGYKLECRSCLHPFTFHQTRQRLLCHHCGASKAPIDSCPRCNSENPWKLIGPGIEKIEDILSKIFPKARLLSLSSDEKFDVNKILNYEVDIIIGTQILAKGHHFPLLRRVIILDADSGIMGYDFRGLEKTFQILQQVSGRAGREEAKGHVWIQTHYPKHPVIQCLLQNDRDKFYKLELTQRQHAKTPPFSRYIGIILSSYNPKLVEDFAKDMAHTFPYTKEVTLFGPAPAPFAKLRGKFRWRFLLTSQRPFQGFIANWLHTLKIPSTIDLRIDVDPYDFY